MTSSDLTPPPPRWRLSPEPPAEEVERLCRDLTLPRALCGLLVVRGHGDPEEAKAYLRPLVEHLHDPSGLPGLDAAVERIRRAVAGDETILVHGDYDVDGICGAALLTRFLRRLGGRPVPFVPHRLRDGYDFGSAGVAAAREAGAGLVVTVDSGIVAHEAVAEAGRAGIDVVVTDHHTPGATLPPAVAVVNPKRPDSSYPEGELCGTALAFKLSQALADAEGIGREELWPRLDLVGLATVADLVPLTGENRTLARFGLKALARSGLPGLRALLKTSGLADEETITAGHAGFRLGPRLNAVGRMGAAARGLELLLTDDPATAREIAGELEEENRRRREADRETLAEALALLEESYEPSRDRGVVLASEGWHPGVIGIVASRVVERIHRPVVMVALDGGRGRGSARSIPGFDLYAALDECSEHFLRFGGHRQAAGLELEAAAVEAFREDFDRIAAGRLADDDLRPVVAADLALALEEVDDELHALLEHAGPFGIGNPRPTFLARGVEVRGRPRVVGDGHLKLRLGEGGRELEAIGFGLARRVPPSALDGGPVDAVFRVRENVYRGVRTLQARLLDIRPHGEPVEVGG